VAVANRVGTEGQVTFWGNSFVTNAFGKVLKRAGSGEKTLVADIDVSQNARIREGWRFTKNRRPDTYASLMEPVSPDLPVRDGYAMPAEWEHHDATWLAWPEDRVTFPNRLDRARDRFVEIIAQLTRGEDVHLAVRSRLAQSRARGLLRAGGVDLRRVQFHVWDYADVWFRDYGPTFVVNRLLHRTSIVQWRFNAWGGKYPPLIKDGNIPYFISERIGISLFMPGIVLEGGAIDVNGRGTLMTTEQCLLNPNRNPGLSKREAARYFADFLGCRRVIWLKGGLAGDDTDGHIDNVARFVNPNTVVCAFEEDAADENYAILKQNFETLCRARDQGGQPLRVVKLPMPPQIRNTVGGKKLRLAASYANFFIANAAVLVPVFNHSNDERARSILAEFFPDRAVVGIDCTDLIYGGGALHCISQQQPSS
jgi:agmatine deiminase